MEFDGLFVGTHSEVYEPHDDTFLLARAVKARVGAGTRFLEVGCGAGVIAMTAAREGAEVTATDANPFAVELCQHNAKQNKLRITAVETDLLAGLEGPFDVVAFNPPYLPTDEDDRVSGPLNLAFDGGLDGNVVVLRFAEQIAALAQRPGEILVIHSSLSDPAPLAARMAELGYSESVVEEEKHFFEALWVRSFRQNDYVA